MTGVFKLHLFCCLDHIYNLSYLYCHCERSAAILFNILPNQLTAIASEARQSFSTFYRTNLPSLRVPPWDEACFVAILLAMTGVLKWLWLFCLGLIDNLSYLYCHCERSAAILFNFLPNQLTVIASEARQSFSTFYRTNLPPLRVPPCGTKLASSLYSSQ